ncbi:MAG: molecular chaperone HtpG [Planctomycetes bacterium]|nr:molecular chaperone HtpG [Planctomycetota bacterium]
MSPAEARDARTYEFQAEVRKLLDILVHSVYSSKDVFIRELISNAADALEKVRFATVRGTDVVPDDREPGIWIETESDGDGDDARKRLIITDNGIGMTEDEVRSNLGTIARSGATAFLEALKDGERDVSLIGQFGIGFYSVFMVAEKVVVRTRSATPGATAVEWESDGLGAYTIQEIDEEIPRGTRIEVHLKAEEHRFAERYTIEDAIRTYSNFVPFPVHLDGKVENKTKAIWREQPANVTDEEYLEFSKFLTFDPGEPLYRLHFVTDSPLQFSALLYAPSTNPESMGFGESEVSLQLYVKRVLIDGSNRDLLPSYLRFIKGVVESEDLPLNISRETLQENRVLAKIRDILTRKVLGGFADIASKDEEKYLEIWDKFGRTLKEGYADFANREKVHPLLRFGTSAKEGLTGLDAYVERMPDAQKAIYYFTGPSRDALDREPRLELLRSKDVEVLYLYDVADEVVLGSIMKYRDKPILSADQVKVEDVAELGDPTRKADDEPAEKAARDRASSLLDRFREILGERVAEIRFSDRLVDSPACLVNVDGTSAHLDKILRIMNKDTELPKRILEVNARHPLIRSLSALVARDAKDPFIEQACEQLFDGAMLADGYLTDPHRFVARMQEVLTEAARSRVPEDPAE